LPFIFDDLKSCGTRVAGSCEVLEGLRVARHILRAGRVYSCE
jgi:hypothetical protein